ncbi:MAG TPA: hypothetical protein VK072_04470 [Candidatus Avamphibacillus sp.]|nr:hypothetical protein [Candidatus Avamphibacillus sp.]
MITVKMLKPYYIKANAEYVRVVLAYQYFSVVINDEVYQFIPIEAKEIRVNRSNKKIENIEARFAFQKGKKIIYMSMTELISLPDFIFQLHTIAKPYFKEEKETERSENEELINELELLNLKRLIDKALDKRDYKSLKELVKYLPKKDKT